MQESSGIGARAGVLEKDDVQLVYTGQRRAEKVPELCVGFYNRLIQEAHAAARGDQLADDFEAADAHAALKRLNAVALLKKLTLQNISRAGARFTQNQALGKQLLQSLRCFPLHG